MQRGARLSKNVGYLLLGLACLQGCGPSKQRQAEIAEKHRIACLDTLCPGDVEPEHDRRKEVALKLNGQWYVGPREYFGGRRGAVFYWPSKTPEVGLPDGKAYPERGKPFYDVAIEIFLGSINRASALPNTYRSLLQEEAKGRVLEKFKPHDGLEIWTTQGGLATESWYIATDSKVPGGDPAVAACRGNGPDQGRCTAGFTLKPNVAVGMRFRSKHAPDWPAIYQESFRVLQQLRRIEQ